MSASQGNNFGWHWNKDPRLPCLGCRGIFPSDATRKLNYLAYLPLLSDFLVYLYVVFHNRMCYDLTFMLSLGVDVAEVATWKRPPLASIGSVVHYILDYIYPPNSNVQVKIEYNGLLWASDSLMVGDFKYPTLILQNVELLPRGDLPPRRLLGLCVFIGLSRTDLSVINYSSIYMTLPDNSSPDHLSKVIDDASSQKKAGTVTTALGSRGFGLLYLDYAFKGTGNLTIKDQEDVNIETIKPDWWPAEWLLGQQEQNAAA